MPDTRREMDRKFLVGLSRAAGGALFFALPLLMTMEMWWLGFYMDRVRLAILLLFIVPVLIVLDRYSGFKETSSWAEDAADGIVAFGVGVVTSTVVLLVFGVIDQHTPWSESLGKVALQAVPASFGAVLANSQLGPEHENAGEGKGEDSGERRQRQAHYPAEVFFMLVGAIFLAFNVAPTEEVVLIAARMTPWHSLALLALSVGVTHAFVFGVEFRGAPSAPEGTPGWSLFVRFTLVGYAVAFLMSAYVLWSFGRYDQAAFLPAVGMTVVLAFPASLGAAGARLIL